MAEDVKRVASASQETKTIISKSVGIENHFVNTSYGPVDKTCGYVSTSSHIAELQEFKYPVDEAVSIGEEGGKRESRTHHRQDSYIVKSDDDGGKRETRTHHRQDSNTTNPAAPHRLLVVSNKTKNNVIMQAAALPNVTTVQYKYESVTLEALLGGCRHISTRV